MVSQHDSRPKLTVPQMLARLDQMFSQQDDIRRQIRILMLKERQLHEDIEMLQNMIMYQSNKVNRWGR